METQYFRLRGSIDSACRPGHFRRHDRLVRRHSPRPTARQVERDASRPVALYPPAWHRQPDTTVRATDTLQHVCIPGSGNVTYRHGSRRQNGADRATRASPPAVARNHASRETWFGLVPDSVRRKTELRHAPARHVANVTNVIARLCWFDIVIAALRQRWLRLQPVAWRIRRRREATDETAIATLGSVEIRRMPPACFAGTCVQGEPAQARETALRRLTNYLNGDNRSSAILRAERPVIQQQLGPRLWRFSVRLSMIPDDLVAPAPRAPKVKLWSMDPGWIAVVRISGRPNYGAVTNGDAMVLDAIANTEWVATRAPMIRLDASGSVRWFTGGFEVVVPVTPRCCDDAQHNTTSSIEEHLPAG